MAHDKLTGDKGLKLQAMANTNAGQKYSVPENNTRGSSVYVGLFRFNLLKRPKTLILNIIVFKIFLTNGFNEMSSHMIYIIFMMKTSQFNV